MSDSGAHVFDRYAGDVLRKCTKIFEQRGGEYQDTWALENQVTLFGDHLERYVEGLRDVLPTVRDRREYKRLRNVAALCDTKLSRLLGAPKDDTTQDLINYVALFTGLFAEYRTVHEFDVDWEESTARVQLDREELDREERSVK